MLAASPAFVAIVGRIFRVERVGSRGWAGIALQLVGIALVVFGSVAHATSGDSLLGSSLLVAGSLCWAFFATLIKPYTERLSGINVGAYSQAGGALFVTAVGIPSIVATNWAACPGAGVGRDRLQRHRRARGRESDLVLRSLQIGPDARVDVQQPATARRARGRVDRARRSPDDLAGTRRRQHHDRTRRHSNLNSYSLVKLVLFDIDGTILWSDGAGRRAMQRALITAFGTSGNAELSLRRQDRHADRARSHAHGRASPTTLIDARMNALLDDYVVGTARGASVRRDARGTLRRRASSSSRRSRHDPIAESGCSPATSRSVRARSSGRSASTRRASPCRRSDRITKCEASCQRSRSVVHARSSGLHVEGDAIVIIGDTPADIDCTRAIGATRDRRRDRALFRGGARGSTIRSPSSPISPTPPRSCGPSMPREVELKSVVDDEDGCRRRVEDAGARLVVRGAARGSAVRHQRPRGSPPPTRCSALRTLRRRVAASARRSSGRDRLAVEDGYKVRDEIVANTTDAVGAGRDPRAPWVHRDRARSIATSCSTRSSAPWFGSSDIREWTRSWRSKDCPTDIEHAIAGVRHAARRRSARSGCWRSSRDSRRAPASAPPSATASSPATPRARRPMADTHRIPARVRGTLRGTPSTADARASGSSTTSCPSRSRTASTRRGSTASTASCGRRRRSRFTSGATSWSSAGIRPPAARHADRRSGARASRVHANNAQPRLAAGRSGPTTIGSSPDCSRRDAPPKGFAEPESRLAAFDSRRLSQALTTLLGELAAERYPESAPGPARARGGAARARRARVRGARRVRRSGRTACARARSAARLAHWRDWTLGGPARVRGGRPVLDRGAPGAAEAPFPRHDGASGVGRRAW